MIDLPLIWAGIVGFAVIMYVLLDGFDLGIGILFPWMPDKHHRDIMMNTIAPIWDGNETWMIFGAAALYGAFPVAYSTLLPALYMPIMFMLAGLIFRGVAFEFRFKAVKSLKFWDFAFATGSVVATFCQGLILGTYLQGYADPTISSIGGYYVWFTPFSIMTGMAMIFGYGLLGATWLISKTVGELQDEMYQAAKVLLFGVAFFMGVVSLWTPFIDPVVTKRWFSVPNFYYLLPLPLTTLSVFIYLFYALHERREKKPFFLTVALFLLAYLGLLISIFPYIIPHNVTIWEAASHPSAMKFLLVGAGIMLPILVAYNGYAYYVFKGKITEEHHAGYHD